MKRVAFAFGFLHRERYLPDKYAVTGVRLHPPALGGNSTYWRGPIQLIGFEGSGLLRSPGISLPRTGFRPTFPRIAWLDVSSSLCWAVAFILLHASPSPTCRLAGGAARGPRARCGTWPQGEPVWPLAAAVATRAPQILPQDAARPGSSTSPASLIPP